MREKLHALIEIVRSPGPRPDEIGADSRQGETDHFDAGMPPGTLAMLILRVLKNDSLHSNAIPQRIHQLSRGELYRRREGSPYSALQKLLIKAG